MIEIDRRYFTWLYSHIGYLKAADPKDSYFKLAEQLYTKEFLWYVQNDDNRNTDGIELRKVFLNETGSEYPGDEWLNMSSSMLELVIGISERLSFLDDRIPYVWFWELIDNLGISYCDDEYDIDVEYAVDDALDRVIWRLYDPDGSGGLFPLQNPDTDQRHVELWYQMSAYVNEKMASVWHL